ncbi:MULTISPECIES: TRAP transporter small permease [Prauserella salsuginis group]|uniref:C4-dicarboxylate transporter DctQ subunit n=2 Tax=Prauserella salsuginis group TaxID=2893672 RepID=A0A839XJX0_9PSEU|nr:MULTISPECIES: TRAP transporter small permease [Prauserella salsuginis group]MBB3664232.1 C4-dicarboxylate transporter DctQ subunit [Prauserella sediminis]MCR3721681.1 TRAP-type C4-dicarboxylate transport system, small permease component [Prauserella flava]MCR3734373.1 TRAP-type C4-dicarboxylate transport system, small permease component [Prauserella salsuginis]
MQKSTSERVLTAAENVLAAVPFAVVAVVAFVNVISRYFLNASLAFTSELTVNLAVWMVMMGAVIGLREGAHLGFSALHEKATGVVRQAMTVLITIAILTFLAVLLYFGIDMAIAQLGSGRATPSIRVPQWLFTAALPVGAIFGVYRTLQASRIGFRRSTVDSQPSEEADR